MARTAILQDVILNALRKEKQLATVHLLNGLPLKGYIKAFDNFVLLLDSPEGKQMMVYKHAISTITPARPVTYTAAPEEENGQGKAD